eukprot:TRINITY_DN8651_c0_g1_i1.p1 TRINITY_DN8651_c0_g1~~TRINITY_DN8651_c0_g1_i1.p1  ORF type:complete len:506 (-),score=78.12 TRINITY_DN8651_c0_g1_i1:55-1485(-)
MRRKWGKSLFVALLSSSFFLTTALVPSYGELTHYWRDDFKRAQVYAASSVAVGATVGCFSFIVLFPRVARYSLTKCVVIADVMLVLGCGLAAGAYAPWMLVLGRLIAGTTVGISSVLVPLYISFICQFEEMTSFRARFGSIHQVVLTCAQSLALISGTMLVHYFPNCWQCWRITHGFCGFMGLVHIVVLYFFGVTPSGWEAIFRTSEIETASPEVVNELVTDDISITFLSRRNMRAMLLAVAMWTAYQVTGSVVVQYYITILLQDPTALYLPTATLLTIVPFVAISGLCADKLGRRPVLIAACFPTVLSLVAVGILFEFFDSHDLKNAKWGVIFFTFVFLAGFAPWVTVPCSFSAEVFAISPRPASMSMAGGIAWLLSVGVIASFQLVSQLSQVWLPAIFFTVAAVLSSLLPFAYLFVPETKGLPMREVPILVRRRCIHGRLCNIRGTGAQAAADESASLFQDGAPTAASSRHYST